MHSKLKTKSFFISSCLLPLFFFGQIKISNNIQDSQINTSSESSLFFVDFWATWCGPCIHVSKYLTSLQTQYPKRFHIMSLSQENPDIVKRFMTKHELKLAVAIDYDGETFSKYNIASLPYGILFNAKGEKLWEGHPAEFKSYHLDGYLSTNTKVMRVDKMYQQQSVKPTNKKADVQINSDFDIAKLKHPTTSFIIEKKPLYLEISGTLKDILTYTNNAYAKQIKGFQDIDNYYKVRFKYNTEAFDNKTQEILRKLKLSQRIEKSTGEVLFLDLEKSKFWDTKQIDWGDDSPYFLIGDSDIKADNVSLNQVSYKLANLLGIPIVTSNNEVVTQLHDWDIHYKYFDLMISNLRDTYGIKAEKRRGEYPKYIITKKTSK